MLISMGNLVDKMRQKPEKVFVCSVWVMPFHVMHHGSQDASLLRDTKKQRALEGPVCSTLLCSGLLCCVLLLAWLLVLA